MSHLANDSKKSFMNSLCTLDTNFSLFVIHYAFDHDENNDMSNSKSVLENIV